MVRQREIDPNAFLPSRFMELQDSKSSKSLAEIYEEDFTNSREKEAGNKVVAKEDVELEKRHSEIEELFEELSGKLDALSNARFTPKPVSHTSGSRYRRLISTLSSQRQQSQRSRMSLRSLWNQLYQPLVRQLLYLHQKKPSYRIQRMKIDLISLRR